MRTILTNYDTKNLIQGLFNESDETITIKDSNGNIVKEMSLLEYLNIDFYVWKNRLVETQNNGSLPIEEYIISMGETLTQSLALVELNDSTIVKSQDIDSATLSGTITFLVQSDKLANLDYLVSKIRNKYVAVPQEIINENGVALTTYFSIGILINNEDIDNTAFGETCIVSLNFAFTYINKALTYTDTKFEFSWDGATFYQIPLSKVTTNTIMTCTSVPKQTRPDITGNIASSVTKTLQATYYDFDLPFLNAFRSMVDSFGDINSTTTNVNVPIFVRKNDTYTYKYILKDHQELLTNGDLNICSFTLALGGK